MLNSPTTSPLASREDQTLSNFLAGERAVLDNYLFDKVDSFESKLKSITEPYGRATLYGEMRYPLDIGQTQEYVNIIRIKTFDTDLVSLENQRSVGKLGEITGILGQKSPTLAEKITDNALVAIDAVSDGVENVKDYLGSAGDGLEGVSQVFLSPALGPFMSGIAALGNATLRQMRQISGGDSDISNDYQREYLGLNQGTKEIPNADIYLYCPPEVRVSYVNSITTQDFQSLTPYILPLSGNRDSIASYAKQLGMSNVKKFGGVLPGIDESVVNSYVENSMRQVINPMNVARFQGTNRRTFQFDFVFYPKSKGEMLSCYKIIEHLKKYSHPSRANDGRFLTYPAEFEINFLDAQTLANNPFLPRISRCALDSVAVVYGESVVMATFLKDQGIGNGSPPTKITLTLTFTELEILTRERFEGELGRIAETH